MALLLSSPLRRSLHAQTGGSRSSPLAKSTLRKTAKGRNKNGKKDGSSTAADTAKIDNDIESLGDVIDAMKLTPVAPLKAPSTLLRGVTIKWLVDFTNRHKCWNLPTYQVCCCASACHSPPPPPPLPAARSLLPQPHLKEDWSHLHRGWYAGGGGHCQASHQRPAMQIRRSTQRQGIGRCRGGKGGEDGALYASLGVRGSGAECMLLALPPHVALLSYAIRWSSIGLNI